MQNTACASVKISPTLKARIQSLAEVRNTSSHALMVQALENFVTREEKREQWRQKGIKAWEEFQATGLHLEHSEVLEWMDKIIAGNTSEPMPKCHV